MPITYPVIISRTFLYLLQVFYIFSSYSPMGTGVSAGGDIMAAGTLLTMW